jgi:lipoprotein-anchoring transpeptidase ErfK/SrfK
LSGCAGLSGADAETPPTVPPPTSTPDVVRRWETYTNADYGFSFQYPAGWALMEGRNFVSLRQGSTSLVLGYRHVTEDVNICCRSQLPEGEVVDAGSLTCAGETVDKALLTCEGRTRAVLYEETGEIAVGDLRFLFYLENFEADQAVADIPADVQRQADQIITSLETFPPDATFETATPRPTKLPPTPEPTAEPTAVPPTETPPPPPIAQVQAEGANVRAGPGTDYALSGYLEPDERVEITGRYADWWRITYAAGSAWIHSGVVEASHTDAVPQVETLPTPVPPSPTLIPTSAPATAITEARWIDVDLSEQRVRAYQDGQVVRSTAVSTGLPETPTVRGQFRIWIKLRYDDMSGPDYYLEDVPYVMYFYSGYGLHGTFWHDNFGQRMSHGCVNLPTAEAAWFFDFADVGTLVNVHE